MTDEPLRAAREVLDGLRRLCGGASAELGLGSRALLELGQLAEQLDHALAAMGRPLAGLGGRLWWIAVGGTGGELAAEVASLDRRVVGSVGRGPGGEWTPYDHRGEHPCRLEPAATLPAARWRLEAVVLSPGELRPTDAAVAALRVARKRPAPACPLVKLSVGLVDYASQVVIEHGPPPKPKRPKKPGG